MLRLWNLNLQLERVAGLSLHLQIAQKIINEIQLGRLVSNTAMPGTRELAEGLNVNRKTVVLAYDELIAQGWLVSESRRGTFVSSRLPSFSSINQHRLQIVESRSITPPLGRSNVINFGEGESDARLIPYEAFSRSFRRALATIMRRQDLTQASPKGRHELRKSIAAMLNLEQGLHVDAENICIVRGSQMGLFIAARAIISNGDGVIFEYLSAPNRREIFSSLGAKLLLANIDDEGIDVEDVERLCRQHKIRAVFVTPQHQYPTAVRLTPERRKRLLRLAEIYDFLIIEDDYGHEFSIVNHAVFPLITEDKTSRVLHIGSLSNVLSPAMNIGYLVGSTTLIDQCATEMKLMDQPGNSAIDVAISELMISGEIKRQMLRLAKIYRERRECLSDLLKNELNDWVKFITPQSGLGFWLSLRDLHDMTQLSELAEAEKIKIVPGAYFSHDHVAIQGIRIGYANLNNKEITEGIARLKYAILGSSLKQGLNRHTHTPEKKEVSA